MQKTLGGDRLGSGKKMKVNLHGYERSTHDMGYLWRSSMSSGTLVPFLSELALPGDTFDINLDCDIKTHPTIGPLFGSYKVQLDVFQAPIRLYHASLHNNALNIGRNMAQIKLPLIELEAPEQTVPAPADPDNAQINPSSILAYLGIRGVGWTTVGTGPELRYFNAIPYLAYWEIYKNYYANKQEEIGVYIHNNQLPLITTVDSITINAVTLSQSPANDPTPLTGTIVINYTGGSPLLEQIIFLTDLAGPISAQDIGYNWVDDAGTTTWTGQYDSSTWGLLYAINWDYLSNTTPNTGQPQTSIFALSNIDDMRILVLQTPQVNALTISGTFVAPYGPPLAKNADEYPYALSSQEGLGVKTYMSDLFNNWLSTDWIDGVGGITEITSIDTSGGSFSIDTLNLSKKVYNMLNRIAVSGGSYDDWLDAVYAHDRYQRCESPMYCGGLIKELVFQEVIANSSGTGTENNNAAQPLGTLAGRGVLGKKHKGGNIIIKVDEPSYIMGIVSLTPRVDYSQGNKWDVHLKTMDDLHKPALDEIGFQELIMEQMAWWDTNNAGAGWVQNSAGKQPAWINYMTNVNKTYGSFAIETNEMFMTLNRRYEMDAYSIKDMTTYIDPSKFNFIFANTALDAQNFWTQIAVNMTVRRKMSAKIMPNL